MLKWVLVYLFVVASMLMVTNRSNAGEPVGYFVYQEPKKEVVGQKQKMKKLPDGSWAPMLDSQGKPIIDDVLLEKADEGKVYLVVVKSLLWVDRLWPDAVYEVPEGQFKRWKGKEDGDEVALPAGYTGWRKVGGSEKTTIRDAAKGRLTGTRYFGNPRKGRAWFHVEKVEIMQK